MLTRHVGTALGVVISAVFLTACGGGGGSGGGGGGTPATPGGLNLTGVVTTLAGDGNFGFLDATGTAARFNHPEGITSDGTNLYVADSNNHRIRQIVIATGVVTTLAGDGNFGFFDATGTAARFNSPEEITSDGTNLYVADANNNRIRRIQ